MGQPNTLAASQHIFTSMIYPALESPRGLSFEFPTAGEAHYYYMRLQNIRGKERKQNREVYPQGDPMHGKSSFEDLVIQHTKGTTTVTLAKGQMLNLKVTEL